MTDERLIDQAITLLIDKRWAMVPSTGPKKSPCVLWKRFQGQLPTVDQLRQWNRTFKPERWGLVTGTLSRIVVVDFDGDLGRSLMEKWGIVPHVRTGSGGFHWYGLHPGWHVPTLNAKTSKQSWPWPGVDIRGDGGFAILLGRNGSGPYEQLRDLVPEPFDLLPAEVCTFLRNHRKGDSTQKRIVPAARFGGGTENHVDCESLIEKALGIAADSGRNNAGFWLACQLRDNGYSLGDATAWMRAYRSRVASTNTKGQVEPYTESEIIASLNEAFSRSARDPWARRKPLPQEGIGLVMVPPAELGHHHTGDSPSQKDNPHKLVIADDPGNLDLYVGHTGEPLTKSRFARIPAEVSGDRQLTPRDVRVYGALAQSCWSGVIAEVGKRRIAVLACCAERLVIQSLKRLESTGHIQKQLRKHGQRGRYVLLSPVFVERSHFGDETASARLSLVRKNPRSAVVSRPASTVQEARQSRPIIPRSGEGAK